MFLLFSWINLIKELYYRILIKNHDLSGIILAQTVASGHEIKQLEVNDNFYFMDKGQVLTTVSL